MIRTPTKVAVAEPTRRGGSPALRLTGHPPCEAATATFRPGMVSADWITARLVTIVVLEPLQL